MKTLHYYLLQEYVEMPLPDPGLEFRTDNIVGGMYGDGERPLVAFGWARTGVPYLGTPTLVWSGPHTPDWSFTPIWPLPEGWGYNLDDTQQAELLAKAKLIATRRKRQYRRCQSCGESTMPEHMNRTFNGKPTCHGCMEQQGVVF